nr:hypothetical protein [Pseudarthrobacter psychrotolerans]
MADCFAACFQYAQTCTACADACLAEDMVADLAACIRTDLDGADFCAATGTILTRQTASNPGVNRTVLEAFRRCETACASRLAASA